MSKWGKAKSVCEFETSWKGWQVKYRAIVNKKEVCGDGIDVKRRMLEGSDKGSVSE